MQRASFKLVKSFFDLLLAALLRKHLQRLWHTNRAIAAKTALRLFQRADQMRRRSH